jgi:DNA-binding transcriptional ArsR family regulator
MNQIFKALNDATRRQILDLLKTKDLSAGEIANAFDISKPSISHHLDLLKQANLVESYRKGQFIYYTLNSSVMDDLIGWLISFSNKNTQKQK